jgi:hypothetical protein
VSSCLDSERESRKGACRQTGNFTFEPVPPKDYASCLHNVFKLNMQLKKQLQGRSNSNASFENVLLDRKSFSSCKINKYIFLLSIAQQGNSNI